MNKQFCYGLFFLSLAPSLATNEVEKVVVSVRTNGRYKKHARKNNWKCQVYSLLLLLCIMKLIEFFSFLSHSLFLFLFLVLFALLLKHTHTHETTTSKKSSALKHFNESFLCIFFLLLLLLLLPSITYHQNEKDNGCRMRD